MSLRVASLDGTPCLWSQITLSLLQYVSFHLGVTRVSFEHLVTDINSIHIPGSFHVIEGKLVTNSWGLLIVLPRIFIVFCSVLQQEKAVR